MPPTAPSRHFREYGFFLLPGVFSPAECDRMAKMFDAYWEASGRPALTGFGLAVHPLLQRIPDMASYYAHAAILDALAAILEDQPRLVHTGARVSDEQSDARLGWHDHYSWDRAGLPSRGRVERVLFGCYLRGLSDDTGPLVVMPRRLNDPIAPCPVASLDPWPGEVQVVAPPGSVVIFDTALWHAARRGTRPGRRYLWGAHCQPVGETRPHPEDNSSAHPRVEEIKKTNPALRRFIDSV